MRRRLSIGSFIVGTLGVLGLVGVTEYTPLSTGAVAYGTASSDTTAATSEVNPSVDDPLLCTNLEGTEVALATVDNSECLFVGCGGLF